MKNGILKIAVFAITLCWCQTSFGEKVTCFEDSFWTKDFYIDAPYFSADLITENRFAQAWVNWDGGSVFKECPSSCGFENIGLYPAGGINVSIGCWTGGSETYAVSEAWGEW